MKNMVRNANAAFSQGAYACITDYLCFLDRFKIRDYAKAIYGAGVYTKDEVHFIIDGVLYKHKRPR